MTWVFVIGLAAASFALIAWRFKVPAGAREALAAALLLGVAGYALQGTPGMPDAPKRAQEDVSNGSGAALIEARQALSGKGPAGNGNGLAGKGNWIVVADGLARNGQFADAAEILRGAVEQEPHNAQAWVAMANALLAHAEGQLTPAALYAYRRAAQADPNDASAPFFLGLALAESGRFAEARRLWADLLERAPAEAPWRPLLQERIAVLDRLIAAGQ